MKKSILILDDDKFILNVFSRILKNQGYVVDAVETGKEALDKIEREKYDLALIDVKLPDINGTDLLPIIHSSHPEMIKIVITGFPDLEDANRIMDQGLRRIWLNQSNQRNWSL